MNHSQAQNVPTSDARLEALRAETRMSLISLEGNLNARTQELKADILRSHAELDAKSDRRLHELEMRVWRIELRIELNRLALLIMLVNVVLTVGVTTLLDAFTHL
jgi:hypothetical protein